MKKIILFISAFQLVSFSAFPQSPAPTPVRLSELPAASALEGAEIVPVVQGGQTRRTTVDLLTTFVISEIGLAAVATSGDYGDLLNLPTLGDLAAMDDITLSLVTDAGGAAALDVGTTAGTVAAGDDARIVNAVQTTGSYGDPSWLTSLHWSKLSGTPTTLSGYGITDAVPTSRTVSAGTGLTGGGALSGNITLSLDSASIASLGLADSAVQPGDTLTSEVYHGETERTVTFGFLYSYDDAGHFPLLYAEIDPDVGASIGGYFLVPENELSVSESENYPIFTLATREWVDAKTQFTDPSEDLALDTDARQLLDDMEDVTVDWQARELVGTWKIIDGALELRDESDELVASISAAGHITAESLTVGDLVVTSGPQVLGAGTLASAATLDLDGVTANIVQVTGTTNVTNITGLTDIVGAQFVLWSDDSTGFVISDGNNIATSGGDDINVNEDSWARVTVVSTSLVLVEGTNRTAP